MRSSLKLRVLVASLALVCTSVALAQDGSPFKKLRSISGAAGHEDKGHFIMDDARSVFVTGKDQKVIVYFEWEGPLGPHHFEGLWKSPEGKIVLISDFRYEATGPHYSGYWTMLLAEGTPSGEWAVEARIDGQEAGTHSFVITGSPGAATPTTPAVPQPLSTAEMYKKAMDATAAIEKIAPDGSVLGKFSAFWIADGKVLTSFQAIDGAASIRVGSRSGSAVSTDQVLAWNRWQDWALLSVPGPAPAKLKRGPKEALNVGDVCAFLEQMPAGARLTDGTITGKNSFPRAGDRLIVASAATPQSYGSPLLNQFGEYVGLVGGATVPGSDPMEILGLMNQSAAGAQAVTTLEPNALAVPLSLLPDGTTDQATSLGALAQKGEFLPLAVKSHTVGLATLTSFIQTRPDQFPFVTDYRQVFSHHDTHASVFVNWTPSQKQKTTCELRLYNLDNVLMTESKPRQLSLAPGKYMSTIWNVPVASMAPGIYRVDLVLGTQTVWRDFFRVTE